MADHQLKTVLKKIINLLQQDPPCYGDSDSVLGMLYESYNDHNRMDSAQIKSDFNALYEDMNGFTLRELDQVIYPVCALCRSHEQNGFINGVKLGVLLYQELTE